MILPSKHIRVAESLLGYAGFILSKLHGPKTIDELWTECTKANDTKRFPAYHGFDQLVLALDYLFIIGAIDINNKGEVYNASPGTSSQ
jgi:hypothetical protein